MTGMLWFDNDPKTELKVKIERAAAYYSKKYGQAPNLVQLHPSMLIAAPSSTVPSITIQTRRDILPNHLLIGIQQGGKS